MEASHGKGAPGEVGGALKRKADMLVSQGKDIKYPKDMFSILVDSQSATKLFFVPKEQVER